MKSIRIENVCVVWNMTKLLKFGIMFYIAEI